ncbi:MAG: polysaccharide export protein [Pseudomonadales bacterium]|nr:polysaccharide export protein [Halioglobus sp.]MCP5129104.1 polysaccharide export protein [Pseudomonadales bacterium]
MVRSVFQAESALQLLVLLLLAVASCGVAVAEGNTSAEAEVSAYRLSVGDRIKVNVLGQADLSVELRVSDTGEIIYPLLGAVEVVGLTREQTEALLYDRLKPDYLVEPVLSVTILSYRQIFLQGEVKQTGPYPYTPGLSLRRAILDAGGFTDLANEDKIYVVNEFDPQGEETRVDQNYRMKPGDIVTVKASLF